jgi:mannose-1-phosphate guanylyltransferase
MHIVILAGGGGTRLWPLSSPDRPKPFLPLLDDESLLQRTVRRLGSLPREGDVTVVTDRRYRALVRAQVPGARILAEPTGRNTAVAIALAAVAVDRPDDEVMVVLPADHSIADEALFASVIADAVAGLAAGGGELAVDDPLVTLGIQVSHASTEYGYLIPDIGRGAVVRGLQGYVLKAFEEKPNRARAQELAEEPGVAWNAGIFLWRRRAILAALERYTAILTMIGPAGGTDAGLAAAYDRLTPISIDYAVMEGSARDGRVLMGAMDVGWSDLGGWPALLGALGARPTGRVVPPGEAFAVGPDDLVVERQDRKLVVVEGPRGSITSSAPTALLAGAAPDRAIVAALVERVAAQEVRP